MRIARFVMDESPRYGILDEETGEMVVLRSDPIYDGLETTGQRIHLDDVRLLSPVIPRSKVIGIGPAFGSEGRPQPPVVFLEPNTAVIGPDDPIVLPSWSHEVHHEVKLAVVISRLCKNVPVASVDKVVYGYTVVNDVTAVDVQGDEPQWVRAKGFDASLPMGPFLHLDLDPSDVRLTATVDGEVRQDARTSAMTWSVAEMVSYASDVFSLLPGDVLVLGTPPGASRIEEGQEVVCEIEGIGRLRNPVVRR